MSTDISEVLRNEFGHYEQGSHMDIHVRRAEAAIKAHYLKLLLAEAETWKHGDAPVVYVENIRRLFT